MTTASQNPPPQGFATTTSQNPPSTGLGLFHYLGEALRIVRWDDAAIRRVKDDHHALPYGIFIWFLANAIPYLVLVYFLAKKPSTLMPEQVLFALATVLVYGAVLGLLQLGIVHLVAKYFCGGDGKFIQILRPLLLASFVYILQAIPLAGMLVANIAWVCVMVMVFDEVDEMPQLTAFLVSAVAGTTLRLLASNIFTLPF